MKLSLPSTSWRAKRGLYGLHWKGVSLTNYLFNTNYLWIILPPNVCLVPAVVDNERRPYVCQIRAKIDKKNTPNNSISTIVLPNNVVSVCNQLTGLMKHKCTNLKYDTWILSHNQIKFNFATLVTLNVICKHYVCILL